MTPAALHSTMKASFFRPSVLLRCAAVFLTCAGVAPAQEKNPPMLPLKLSWEKNILTIRGDMLPGGKLETLYLEAYCRAGSTNQAWDKTVIPHRTELVSLSPDATDLRLKCQVSDGVTVDHEIRVVSDGVQFSITAKNSTGSASDIHWGQPCVRVGEFTGLHDEKDKYRYIRKCFIFAGGQPQFLPSAGWQEKALYVPGQVWRAPGVSEKDVNPRPLNPNVPEDGVIGCVSGDGKLLLGIAFDPWQELFQGVIECIHADFRLGGIPAGETKRVRGKFYLVPNNPAALLRRYREEFRPGEPKTTGPATKN
jgi:hypothetical protein